MKINLQTNHPSCTNKYLGSITIINIILEYNERAIYGNDYKIVWSNNIEPKNLIHDNRSAINLLSGQYSICIEGNGNRSEPHIVDIVDQSPFFIKDIQTKIDYCNHKATLIVAIEGDTAPYTLLFDKYRKTSDNNIIILDNIDTAVQSKVLVLNNTKCYVESDIINIEFFQMSYSIDAIKIPKLYDDHVSEFLISVKNSETKHKFIIYDADDYPNNPLKTIGFDVSEKLLVDHYQYNLFEYIYPGSSIIEIYDENGCSIKTDPIVVSNTNPLSVNIDCINNYQDQKKYQITTSFIYDTILIPYRIFMADNNIKNCIEEAYTNKNHNINIFVNSIKYKPSLLDDQIKLICLGPSTDDWYVRIKFFKGFDIDKEPNLLNSSLILSVNNINYHMIFGFFTNSEDIQLIRSTLISDAINIGELNYTNNIDIWCGEKDNTSLLYSKHKPHIEYTKYKYTANNCCIVDVVPTFDLSINGSDFSSETLEHMEKISHFLQMINIVGYQTYIIDVKPIKNSGSIVINSYYDPNIKLEYYKYDYNTGEKFKIFIPNTNNTNYLTHLDAGLYIIKIIDDNPLNYINHKPYPDHYEASVRFLKDEYNIDHTSIEFKYGDILVALYNDPFNKYNIPGVSNSIIVQNNPKEYRRQSQSVPKIYDLQIIPNIPNVLYHIYGPDNFYQKYTNIAYINGLKNGIYTIKPDEDSLSKHSLYDNKSYEVIIDNNKFKKIYLIFEPNDGVFFSQKKTG